MSLSHTTEKQNYNKPFTIMGLLFFFVGVITCLNDILIPHLKTIFVLDYSQAALIQVCFFSAYFIVAFPATAIIHKIGYQRSIVLGLSIASCGVVIFYPASELLMYGLFLTGLFFLASGFALMQTAINPYVAAMGKPETASSRLVLAQGFYSAGTTIAPYIGGQFILNTGGSKVLPQQLVTTIQMPYTIIFCVLVAMALIVTKLTLPVLPNHSHANQPRVSIFTPLQHKHLVLGVIAIFFYVGAEVTMGSFMVSYIKEATELTQSQASGYVIVYWGGLMVGRFIGAWILQRVQPNKLLAIVAVCSAALVTAAVRNSGMESVICLLICGVFNSIMFATIFTLAIKGLGAATQAASSWLIAAILGGAIIPLVQGAIADALGGVLHMSYVVPLFCYLVIAYYGIIGYKTQPVQQSEKVYQV